MPALPLMGQASESASEVRSESVSAEGSPVYEASVALAKGEVRALRIDRSRIRIARDDWGIPHVHAPTDNEAAFGLAWATAEDDFESMQHSLLAVHGRLAEVEGKDGAILDVVAFLVDVDGVVDRYYGSETEKDLGEAYEDLIAHYAAGVNAYAETHPDEVLLEGVFPVGVGDMLKAYVLGVTGMTGLEIELLKVFNGTIANFETEYTEKGSNAMAFSAHRMADERTHLIVNSHQPLSGPMAWYEAHVVSDEGWNMMGGTFPGAATIFVGTNAHLGWGHTLNYPDYTDVYKLEMHPKDKLRYRYDGAWLDLEERKFKFKVKVGPIKLGIKRTFYRSVHGPVVKNKEGYYALRFPAMFGIRAGEQWYRMNKAANFEEFRQALELSFIPGINVIYADDQDNIYYLANGHFPERHPDYDWKKVLPGDTSLVNWAPEFDPIDSLPQYLNPECGYLFNTNNSPFFATCPDENLDPADYDPRKGYLLWNNNRALRFHDLVSAHEGPFSLEDIQRIKYDRQWRKPAETIIVSNLERPFQMDPEAFPKIEESLRLLKSWDRNTEPENTGGAAVWSMCIHFAIQYLMEEGRLLFPNELTDAEFEDIVRDAQKHLKRHFGRLDVPLGELQRHVRGEDDYPVGGGADVLAAMHTEPWKKGRMQSRVGDGLIQFVSYGAGWPQIQAMNCYGASNHEDSPHFDDQIEPYLRQELRPMTLDMEQVLEDAQRVYHPGWTNGGEGQAGR
jgi:acyl-homoserine-lactone acylase